MGSDINENKLNGHGGSINESKEQADDELTYPYNFEDLPPNMNMISCSLSSETKTDEYMSTSSGDGDIE